MNNQEPLIINNVIEITQPIGTFLVAKVTAKDLLSISYRDERTYNKELSNYVGTQRQLKSQKLKSVKEFISTRDATFPNTIIGALSDSSLYDYNNGVLTIVKSDDIDEKAFQVIDGQHRLWGFEDSPNADNFELIVTFFLNADVEDQAYIFSIINTTQSKLDPSLVCDLTDLSKITTPENSIHSIAKVFNNREDSPWFKSIKMIGKKDLASSNGIISQYSFNKSILKYVYDKKESARIRNILIDGNNDRTKLNKIKMDSSKFIFWEYYVNSEEDILYKTLHTYFSALKDIYIDDKWCNSSSILCKTSGYSAFMQLFKDFYDYNNSQLTNIDFYKNILAGIKDNVEIEAPESRLGAAGAANLYNELKQAFRTQIM